MNKKVLGLILELNPFHNGHKYFIDQVKKEINPDLTVAIITSSFTMRGEVSILDKFEKTRLLLESGIDMVVELPFVFSNNSANYFASSSISILNEFNITHLAFGSEAGNIDSISKIYEITKSAKYNESIKYYLDKGNSYPNSNLKAFMDSTNDLDLINQFPLPNNTLALAYLDAINNINNKIIPYTIKRIDNNYYSKEVSKNKFASATALRNCIDNNENISDYVFYEYDFVKQKDFNNKLYELLKYNLIQNRIIDIANISEGIENRLLSFINDKDYDSFVKDVSTKRYTVNRIQRTILNIVFQVNKKYEDMKEYPKYLRILGMNNDGIKYLKSLKNKKIINNTKDALDNESKDIKEILNKELEITKIYDSLTGKDTFNKEFMLVVKK